jgi:hypothetical protein
LQESTNNFLAFRDENAAPDVFFRSAKGSVGLEAGVVEGFDAVWCLHGKSIVDN